MPQPISITIPHRLGREEARRRIEAGFGQLQQQMTGGMMAMLSLEQRWEGDKLQFQGSALGQKLTGRIEVLADSVQVQLDLPIILAAIADQISAKLKRAGQLLLEEKKA